MYDNFPTVPLSLKLFTLVLVYAVRSLEDFKQRWEKTDTWKGKVYEESARGVRDCSYENRFISCLTLIVSCDTATSFSVFCPCVHNHRCRYLGNSSAWSQCTSCDECSICTHRTGENEVEQRSSKASKNEERKIKTYSVGGRVESLRFRWHYPINDACIWRCCRTRKIISNNYWEGGSGIW